MTREKDKLVAFKCRNGFKNKEFQHLDIVPLIVRVWASSFTRTEKNKHALMERGWYHLDKRLREDPEILRTQGPDAPSMPSPPPSPIEDDTPPVPTPIETPIKDDTPPVPTPIETPIEDDTPAVPTPIETPIIDDTPSVPTPIETPIVDDTPSVPTTVETPIVDDTPSVPTTIKDDTPSVPPPPIETPIEDDTPSVPPILHVEVPHMSDVSAVSELNSLNLNFIDGIAGTMTTDLMTFLLRKQKIYEAYQKRKEEGQRVRTRLQEEALKGTRLTGGALFKIRKVVLCDEVLEVRKGRDAAIQNTKIYAVVKLVEKFNKRLEKYSTVISSTRKEEEYTNV
jgi:hypothetical protein